MASILQYLNQVKLSKQTLLALVIGLALFNAILYLRLDPSISTKIKANSEELLSIFNGVYHRHKKLEKINTRLVVYDEIFSQVSMYDFLSRELYAERCLIYFNHLSMSVPDWLINPHENVDMKSEAFHSFEDYENKRVKAWKQEVLKAEKENKLKPERPSTESMRKDYEEIINKMRKDEQLLHDFASHVRVFDRCFLKGYFTESGQSQSQFISQQKNFLKRNIDFQPTSEEKAANKDIYRSSVSCSEVEKKIFPFISREYPLFTRWDGSEHFFPNAKLSGLPNRECFLTDFQKHMNGKGIVITVGDGQVEDASRLIRSLRFHKNQYPIQAVFHSSLSEESKGRLVTVAREDFHDFPPQDLWFVDCKRAIKPLFINKFHGFANKLLAMLFNSFEEILLLDADAGLLKSPEWFFELNKYKETGAYFYRDRAAHDSRGMSDTVFFSKMLPSIEDSIIFNIDQTSNYTLDNGFFNGMGHYMESGVVVLDRKKHFIQPLMMSVISFYHPINGRIYGDKEMFWLAVAIAGRNDYHFNENAAAAVGEFLPAADEGNPHMKAKRMCTAHPAHISGDDNHTLVWVNSGFRFCSKSRVQNFDMEREFEMKALFKWFHTIDDFADFYTSPLVVKYALLPPHSFEGRRRNDENEPENFWEMTRYCRGYLWCGYSRAGGKVSIDGKTVDNHIDGRIIELGDQQAIHFAEVASYWIEELPWLTYKKPVYAKPGDKKPKEGA